MLLRVQPGVSAWESNEATCNFTDDELKRHCFYNRRVLYNKRRRHWRNMHWAFKLIPLSFVECLREYLCQSFHSFVLSGGFMSAPRAQGLSSKHQPGWALSAPVYSGVVVSVVTHLVLAGWPGSCHFVRQLQFKVEMSRQCDLGFAQDNPQPYIMWQTANVMRLFDYGGIRCCWVESMKAIFYLSLCSEYSIKREVELDTSYWRNTS